MAPDRFADSEAFAAVAVTLTTVPVGVGHRLAATLVTSAEIAQRVIVPEP